MTKRTHDIVLRMNNLAIGYGDSRNALLTELNLELRAGELICFMGPNGIGKSTLIRTLAGLQKPLSGEVILSAGQDKITQIAVVLTEKISAGNMTVYELITYGRYPYLDWNIRLGEGDRQIIDDAIAQVHIQSLADKKLYELSDGQLQMAMIARALTQTTPIIILDEPTAHLDLNNRVEVMRLLHNLARKKGKSIIVATHELDLALQIADLIWLTGKNRNIITGIPEELVLNGMFDAIFEFKGFDLKTGKVQHEVYRTKPIRLIGEGHAFLWTKNALERNGFEVSDLSSARPVHIHQRDAKISWIAEGNSFDTLRDLLDFLIRAA